jgi:hypothetical protein
MFTRARFTSCSNSSVLKVMCFHANFMVCCLCSVRRMTNQFDIDTMTESHRTYHLSFWAIGYITLTYKCNQHCRSTLVHIATPTSWFRSSKIYRHTHVESVEASLKLSVHLLLTVYLEQQPFPAEWSKLVWIRQPRIHDFHKIAWCHIFHLLWIFLR